MTKVHSPVALAIGLPREHGLRAMERGLTKRKQHTMGFRNSRCGVREPTRRRLDHSRFEALIDKKRRSA